MVLFPLIWMLLKRISIKKLRFVCLFPVIACVLTFILCSQYKGIHILLRKNYTFYGIAMRFIQGGMAFHFNGVHLLGHQMQHLYDYIEIGPDAVLFYVIDNPYVGYCITRGLIWLVLCLVWYMASFRKCIVYKDKGLLLVGCILTIISMMELRGLDAWFNIMFVYFLAKTTGVQKPETVNVIVA